MRDDNSSPVTWPTFRHECHSMTFTACLHWNLSTLDSVILITQQAAILSGVCVRPWEKQQYWGGAFCVFDVHTRGLIGPHRDDDHHHLSSCSIIGRYNVATVSRHEYKLGGCCDPHAWYSNCMVDLFCEPCSNFRGDYSHQTRSGSIRPPAGGGWGRDLHRGSMRVEVVATCVDR